MALAVETLEAELSSHGGDLDWSLRVFRQICLGVQGLHQAGVIHRDLKPANVLRMADGRHVVADLGTAKREPRNSTVLTRTCAILGTISYLAPEQFMPGGSRHADPDRRLSTRQDALPDDHRTVSCRDRAIRLATGLGHIVGARRLTVPPTATRTSPRCSKPWKAINIPRRKLSPKSPAASSNNSRQIDRLAGRRAARSQSNSTPCWKPSTVWIGSRTTRSSMPWTASLPIFCPGWPTTTRPVPGALRHLRGVLERAVARRHFQYADVVARRMQAVFRGVPKSRHQALALEALLTAAVLLNRYAAMTVFKRLLYQIKDAETALRVAEMLRDHRDDFQEMPPASPMPPPPDPHWRDQRPGLDRDCLVLTSRCGNSRHPGVHAIDARGCLDTATGR